MTQEKALNEEQKKAVRRFILVTIIRIDLSFLPLFFFGLVDYDKHVAKRNALLAVRAGLNAQETTQYIIEHDLQTAAQYHRQSESAWLKKVFASCVSGPERLKPKTRAHSEHAFDKLQHQIDTLST